MCQASQRGRGASAGVGEVGSKPLTGGGLATGARETGTVRKGEGARGEAGPEKERAGGLGCCWAGFDFGSGWVCFPSYFYSISKQNKTI